MKQRCARADPRAINEKPEDHRVSLSSVDSAPCQAVPYLFRNEVSTIVIVSVLDATGNACALRYCNR
jgi:hypothetical protein